MPLLKFGKWERNEFWSWKSMNCLLSKFQRTEKSLKSNVKGNLGGWEKDLKSIPWRDRETVGNIEESAWELVWTGTYGGLWVLSFLSTSLKGLKLIYVPEIESKKCLMLSLMAVVGDWAQLDGLWLWLFVVLVLVKSFYLPGGKEDELSWARPCHGAVSWFPPRETPSLSPLPCL